MDSWIRQVHILDPTTQRDQVGDVLIRNGVIEAVGDNLNLSDQEADNNVVEVDGQRCVLGPGLIDLYSCTGEPGHESRETLTQLLAAAAQGGFTRVGILPNTLPAVDNPAQVAQRLACQIIHQPKVLAWGALTEGARGEQLTDLMELSDSGIIGFCDGQPLNNSLLLQRLLDYTQSISLPVALWPCSRVGICRDGTDAIRFGLSPVAATAETIPLASLLEEIADIQRQVHVMRLSTARSVELIRSAKARGLPVTASVTWLHLLFSTADLGNYAPSLRLAPPLGTPDDKEALITGIEDGTLDAIAVDHCVHTYEEKAVPFGIAPPGAVGLQLALPVLWQTFVSTKRWTALQLWSTLSTNPAQCLGIEAGSIQVGTPANLVLFDPGQPWLVTSKSLGCDAINSPYAHQTIQGKVKHMWLDGELITI